MKIAIHDYCGHPFQFNLSKNLEKNGYSVIHLFSSNSLGPKAITSESYEDGLIIHDVKQNKVDGRNLFKRLISR